MTSGKIQSRWGLAEVSTLCDFPSFWPTVLCKVEPLSRHVVCLSSVVVVCDVLYCGLYDRQTADVCTCRGIFGALTPLPVCISIAKSLRHSFCIDRLLCTVGRAGFSWWDAWGPGIGVGRGQWGCPRPTPPPSSP